MNVLAICPGYIPSVMLCGDCQFEYLKSSKKLDYKFLVPSEVTEADLNWLDVLYVIRGDSSYILSLAKWCKKHKKIVIYVIDDNLLEIPTNLSASSYYLKKSTKRSIRKLINLSQGFVSPSINLINKYSSVNSDTVTKVFRDAQKKALEACQQNRFDCPYGTGNNSGRVEDTTKNWGGNDNRKGDSNKKKTAYNIDMDQLVQMTLYYFDKLILKEMMK